MTIKNTIIDKLKLYKDKIIEYIKFNLIGTANFVVAQIFYGQNNRKFLDDMNLELLGQLPMNSGIGNVSIGIYKDGDEEVEGLFNPIVINMVKSLEKKEKEVSNVF